MRSSDPNSFCVLMTFRASNYIHFGILMTFRAPNSIHFGVLMTFRAPENDPICVCIRFLGPESYLICILKILSKSPFDDISSTSISSSITHPNALKISLLLSFGIRKSDENQTILFSTFIVDFSDLFPPPSCLKWAYLGTFGFRVTNRT